MGIFIALALGLNIVVGLAGLLDLGYVAFFAVGAYSWAIVGSPARQPDLRAAASRWRPAGSTSSSSSARGRGLTGVLLGLPVLRLRGDYLAIVTLGFGEVIRMLANNLDKPINITDGPGASRPSGDRQAPLPAVPDIRHVRTAE